MEYNFADIEGRAKEKWAKEKVYKVSNESTKEKFYILDMFPYPSGAGLHVGHPLGYIASDIYARYKRLKGYNVLHPMGFDAFGLPAEQYALETGQHPAVTTEKNIKRYREQLDNIGFCYDWDRQVQTSDPKYYKWTQWIFLQLFNSWYDRSKNKTKPISELIELFTKEGNINYPCPDNDLLHFDAIEWVNYTEKEKRAILMQYRIAYQGYAEVWWCENLGTVLANDEVVNGVSERGGFPVEKKNMRQWFLRITEYAERLLNSLDKLEWSDAMKEMQRNWIGKSNGMEIKFQIAFNIETENDENIDLEKLDINKKASIHTPEIKVFTTRPDTIMGVDFMVLAPEHELLATITTNEHKTDLNNYIQYVKSRSERERISDVKQITGCFTGNYVIHPLTHKKIPIWVSEYVLAGYGTGAIMGVPCGDDRDHAFAKHFKIPITNIFGIKYTGEKAYTEKTGTINNSGILDGMSIQEAGIAAMKALAKVGQKKTNFKLRDAGFSRQRYWGEPFPIIYRDGIPYGTDEITDVTSQNKNTESIFDLPVELPMVKQYKPGPDGQGPLANIIDWVNTDYGTRETNTMPGYAGSSWYFLRYMDPHNDHVFADRKATDYWQQVDLYVGGTEHAVGHLLYSRMWTKALYDLGHIGFDEPFKKLLNQGMIQGKSYFTDSFYAFEEETNEKVLFLISHNRAINFEKPFVWNEKKYKKSPGSNEFRLRNAHFFVDAKGRLTKTSFKDLILFEGAKESEVDYLLNLVIWNGKTEDDEWYILCNSEIEKMSKSKHNVVTPDDIVNDFGADTFRMYEMFLGPIEMSKPWDTKGIEGVHRFLKKFWRQFFDEQKGWVINDETPTNEELRILHKAIKKIGEDMERFSFNTSVSQFMITINELAAINCRKKAIWQQIVILICPYAPHIAEELWRYLGNTNSVIDASFPVCEESYLIESTKIYPVAVNGKPRIELEFPLDAEQSYIEATVLANDVIQKWMEGKPAKKVIFVKGKMINIVI